MNNTLNTSWEEYISQERSILRDILLRLGFSLHDVQPHTQGERYLMHAVTTKSGQKIILLGTRISDGLEVVIKATRQREGSEELRHERVCREVLGKIRFAYREFITPEEIFFGVQDGFTIAIQKFIPQESTFLERPLKEQFTFALDAFKAQEGAHATTYSHIKLIRSTFGSMSPKEYISAFAGFKKNMYEHDLKLLVDRSVLEKAEKYLQEKELFIAQYGNFLTHTDFVPHNFRISGGTMYLLDYSSLRFGNKYEGWARFLNFMALYNPALTEALQLYVQTNRSDEEYGSLQAMRVYRLGEIIWYYVRTLSRSEGPLLELNSERVLFWTQVLNAVLNGTTVSHDVLEQYRTKRDLLRSAGELERQKGLH